MHDTLRPPTIDPAAARRWAALELPAPAWLHEEVARRMAERLDWITRQPASWLHWDPLRGGTQAHALLRQRYPQARTCMEAGATDPARVRQRLEPMPWWRAWLAGRRPDALPSAGVDMLWANMALHMADDPQALIARWHEALAVDGFLMFSCLGPDTLRELRALYAGLDWPPPAHDFTDMHDWGDMLVAAGFAEPVLDVERIVLTFATPQRLLQELRELGRNLHPARFPGLRGRDWRQRLEQAIAGGLRNAQGQFELTFEVIYGHAIKPAPRLASQTSNTVALEDVRQALRQRKK